MYRPQCFLSSVISCSQSLQSSRTPCASLPLWSPCHFLCSHLPSPTRSVEGLSSTTRQKERILTLWNPGTLKCLNRALDFNSAPLFSKSGKQRVWCEKVPSYLTMRIFFFFREISAEPCAKKFLALGISHWEFCLDLPVSYKSLSCNEEHRGYLLNAYTKGTESRGLTHRSDATLSVQWISSLWRCFDQLSLVESVQAELRFVVAAGVHVPLFVTWGR